MVGEMVGDKIASQEQPKIMLLWAIKGSNA